MSTVLRSEDAALVAAVADAAWAAVFHVLDAEPDLAATVVDRIAGAAMRAATRAATRALAVEDDDAPARRSTDAGLNHPEHGIATMPGEDCRTEGAAYTVQVRPTWNGRPLSGGGPLWVTAALVLSPFSVDRERWDDRAAAGSVADLMERRLRVAGLAWPCEVAPLTD